MSFDWQSKFPYHYGSHATGYSVSTGHYRTSFHTTMVLTQLQNSILNIYVLSSFHTTMVLTQHRRGD